MGRTEGPRKGHGWLLRDGTVVASTVPASCGGHLARASSLADEVGSYYVTGPALVIGLSIIRPGDDERLRSVRRGPRPRLVGFNRTVLAVRPHLAESLQAGDRVNFRAGS